MFARKMKYLILALVLVGLQACNNKVSYPPVIEPGQLPQSRYEIKSFRDFLDDPNFDPFSVSRPDLEGERLGKEKGVVKVALLVPLSGDHSKIGKSLMDAAALALFDKYKNVDDSSSIVRVQLIPKDTEGKSYTAARKADEAIKEGAEMIIGPLFSASVEAVAPVAKRARVPVLSFSNNALVAKEGIFTFGFLPDQQAARIAKFALNKGYKNIAVFAPDNQYGVSVANSFSRASVSLNVAPVIFYPPSATNLSPELNKIIYAGGKFDADGYAKQKSYDAIFIPEGGNRAKNIARLLSSNGIDLSETKLLGTGLWDDEDLSESSYLRGSYFASAPRDTYNYFVERFNAFYDYRPVRIASLSYDAVALAASIAIENRGKVDAQAITKVYGYFGPANGIFRCYKNGVCERGLAVMKIDEGKISEVSSAPGKFSLN